MTKQDFRIPHDHAQALVDPAAYADGRIHETHAWLRANNPVGWAEPDGFDPFWVLTRYDDIRAVSRDNKKFPVGDNSVILQDKASDTFIRQVTGGRSSLARGLVQMDPPDHMKFRLLTQSWFMPKNLRTISDRIGQIADQSVEKMMSMNGVCDFAVDVIVEYPLKVVMDIIGVPLEDLPFMMRLTQEVFAPLDPECAPEGVDMSDPAAWGMAMMATFTELSGYFKKITADRRANPRNDIATLIANAKVDGEPLSDMDEAGYFIILATAGHDTTSSSSAAVMWALASQPGLLDRVKADPSLIPALVDEAVRWASPVKTFMRSAAQDIEFAGRPFEQGDWIQLCYPSGNRDEAIFPDGGAFDIDRPKMEHVAFGYGAHVCLGQFLARQEMTALYERLIPRLKSVQLDGETAQAQSFFVTGFTRLPIRFEIEP